MRFLRALSLLTVTVSLSDGFLTPDAIYFKERSTGSSLGWERPKPRLAVTLHQNVHYPTRRCWVIRRFKSKFSDDDDDNDDDDELMTLLEQSSKAGNLYYLDVLVVGAGAAGVGVTHALLRGGMEPKRMMLIDRGDGVGSSFREWHETTRFISPSWPGYPFGIQDLNAVVPDTSVFANNGNSEHPTGHEYADYLERMMKGINVPQMYKNAVTSIERVPQGCFVVKTARNKLFIAKYVVWCGGEWISPRLHKFKDFPVDAAVHYKFANVEDLLESRRSPEDPIVLVGGGEAGADLGCALANRGARIVILESESDDNDGNGGEKEEHVEEAVMDPSRRLSPATQERIERNRDKIEFKTNARCLSAKRDHATDTVTVTFEERGGGGNNKAAVVETIDTGANVVMCTGFDPSRNSVLKERFRWKDGSPIVTPEHDESTITKDLYFAGPALMHTLTCRPGQEDVVEEKEKGNNNENEGDDDSKNIIFCFVYKYRTRFAVVASEILRRFVEDQRSLNETEETKSEFSKEALEAIETKREQMQKYYRSKGMMLTDLSCAQLACGMNENDAPVYDYYDDGCGEACEKCDTCE